MWAAETHRANAEARRVWLSAHPHAAVRLRDTTNRRHPRRSAKVTGFDVQNRLILKRRSGFSLYHHILTFPLSACVAPPHIVSQQKTRGDRGSSAYPDCALTPSERHLLRLEVADLRPRLRKLGPQRRDLRLRIVRIVVLDCQFAHRRRLERDPLIRPVVRQARDR